MTSRPLKFLLQNDYRLLVAAIILRRGGQLTLDQQTYILSQGLSLERFEARFAT